MWRGFCGERASRCRRKSCCVRKPFLIPWESCETLCDVVLGLRRSVWIFFRYCRKRQKGDQCEFHMAVFIIRGPAVNHFDRRVDDMIFELIHAVDHRRGQITPLPGDVAVPRHLYGVTTSPLILILEIGYQKMNNITHGHQLSYLGPMEKHPCSWESTWVDTAAMTVKMNIASREAAITQLRISASFFLTPTPWIRLIVMMILKGQVVSRLITSHLSTLLCEYDVQETHRIAAYRMTQRRLKAFSCGGNFPKLLSASKERFNACRLRNSEYGRKGKNSFCAPQQYCVRLCPSASRFREMAHQFCRYFPCLVALVCLKYARSLRLMEPVRRPHTYVFMKEGLAKGQQFGPIQSIPTRGRGVF